MDNTEKSRIKVRGVLLATGGLATALLVMLSTGALGLVGVTLQQWLWAAALTALVQVVLLTVAVLGWDTRIPGDPHYLHTPFTGAMLLLSLYMYLAPELRLMVLLGWFVALLFMAGLGGFRAVVSLSAVMLAGYFVVASLLYRSGYPLSLPFEAAVSRHFQTVLRAELDRVLRYGGQCAVAMVDVDYFRGMAARSSR